MILGLSRWTGQRLLMMLAVIVSSVEIQAQTLEQLIDSGVIPKEPFMPLSRLPLLNRIQQGDLQMTVFLSRRKAGTGTPIHEHAFGGIDYLVAGEATLYYDNQEARVYRAPMCVHMPPGVRTVNVASGKQDTVFYNIFFGPNNFDYWRVDEQGVAEDVIHDFDRHPRVR